MAGPRGISGYDWTEGTTGLDELSPIRVPSETLDLDEVELAELRERGVF